MGKNGNRNINACNFRGAGLYDGRIRKFGIKHFRKFPVKREYGIKPKFSFHIIKQSRSEQFIVLLIILKSWYYKFLVKFNPVNIKFLGIKSVYQFILKGCNLIYKFIEQGDKFLIKFKQYGRKINEFCKFAFFRKHDKCIIGIERKHDISFKFINIPVISKHYKHKFGIIEFVKQFVGSIKFLKQ